MRSRSPWRRPACPRCGSAAQVVPILYGLPTEEGFEAARRGEVKLGGCLVEPWKPEWWCLACDAGFRTRGKR